MAGLRDEYTTDFGGGQVDAAAATRLPKNAVAVLTNGRINADNSISRRRGGVRTHASTLGAGTPYGGIMYTTAGGVDQLLVFLDDNCYMSSDSGVTWTDVTPTTGGVSDLVTTYYDFAIMRIGANNYLFAANGDTLWKWDGSSWAATANAPSGAKFVEVFNNRLAVAGDDGMFVTMSAVDDPETWAIPDGLKENVLAHGASEITGLFALGARLMVFSEETCSLIDGYGEQTLVIQAGARGLSRSVGCYAFRTLTAVGDDAVSWLSGRGVEYYSPSTGIRLLSAPVQSFMDTFDRALVRNTRGIPDAVYDAPNQNYELLLSTVGTRSDRVLVANMLQNVSYQREDSRLAAFGVDQWDTAGGAAGSEFLLVADAGGYESNDPGGLRLKVNSLGYEKLASSGAGGIPIVADADGYEDEDLNDVFPGSLFIGPSSEFGTMVYSVGYDGFVRSHDGLDTDDEESDGTAGSPITLRVVSRPFLFGSTRTRKRVRVIRVGAVQDEEATFTAYLRVNGVQKPGRTITIGATALDQPKRGRAMVSGVGDTPQVEITSTDGVQITMIGLSAETLRERMA